MKCYPGKLWNLVARLDEVIVEEVLAIDPAIALPDRGGPVFRNRMAAWLRWSLGWVTPPISPRLPA
jgi:hypothetical protein